MSDPKSSYGEPVEEPTPEGDVVGRAHEGLAEAEAARRDSVEEQTADASAPVAEPAPEQAAPAAAEPDPWTTPEAASLNYERAQAADADTAVYDKPAVSAYDPTAETVVA